MRFHERVWRGVGIHRLAISALKFRIHENSGKGEAKGAEFARAK